MALGPFALFALTIVAAVTTGGPLRVGQPAPDFNLKDQNGRDVRLSDFRGKKTVVLAFYIRAFTPGWRKELLAYQADIANFEKAGAQVIGISVDSAKRNRDFANELHITFPVLSDESKQVTREYGVLYPLIRVAKRVTFVIDRQGVIREISEGGEAADPNKREQSCSLLPH